jgi:glycolate oxidase
MQFSCTEYYGVSLDPERLGVELGNIVGEDRVSSKLFERRLYGHDLAPLPTEVSLIFKTTPDAVVKPRTPEDVSRIVRYANENRIPVIPRGTSSWGFGGTIPTKGGIVIDLKGLKEIHRPNKKDMTVTVGAGARWEKINEILEMEGYNLQVYPTSAPAATVGGWIATGGLGIGSVKYGHLQENIASIQVVTPMGDAIRLNHDAPDFGTYFGSEGTLGVITEATIRITEKQETRLVLTSFKEYTPLVKVIGHTEDTDPFFVEIMDRGYLDIQESIGIESPHAQILCLFVYEGDAQGSVEKLVKKVQDLGGEICSEAEAEEEWAKRFYYMKIKKAGPTLLAGEVTFPLEQLPMVVSETYRLKERHGLQLGVKAFMVGKGTVLFMPMFLADERKRWKYLSTLPLINDITDIGLKAGGRPYGFGIWNSFYLNKVYDPDKVKELKARKKRMDPQDVMNPGKFYQVVTKYGIPLWGRAFRLFTWVLGALRML